MEKDILFPIRKMSNTTPSQVLSPRRGAKIPIEEKMMVNGELLSLHGSL